MKTFKFRNDLSEGEIEESQKKLSTQELNEERFRYQLRIFVSFLSVTVLSVFLVLIWYLVINKSLHDPYIIGIFVGATTLILYKMMASSMPFRESNDKEHPLISAVTELVSTFKDSLGKK